MPASTFGVTVGTPKTPATASNAFWHCKSVILQSLLPNLMWTSETWTPPTFVNHPSKNQRLWSFTTSFHTLLLPYSLYAIADRLREGHTLEISTMAEHVWISHGVPKVCVCWQHFHGRLTDILLPNDFEKLVASSVPDPQWVASDCRSKLISFWSRIVCRPWLGHPSFFQLPVAVFQSMLWVALGPQVELHVEAHLSISLHISERHCHCPMDTQLWQNLEGRQILGVGKPATLQAASCYEMFLLHQNDEVLMPVRSVESFRCTWNCPQARQNRLSTLISPCDPILSVSTQQLQLPLQHQHRHDRRSQVQKHQT